MSSDSQYVVGPGDRTTLLQGPLGAVLMLGAERTDGRLSVVEHPLAPRALGSPVHTHRTRMSTPWCWRVSSEPRSGGRLSRRGQGLCW